MNYKRWFVGALALWVVTIGIVGYFFVKRSEQILRLLADLTSRCTACHERYRFSTTP